MFYFYSYLLLFRFPPSMLGYNNNYTPVPQCHWHHRQSQSPSNTHIDWQCKNTIFFYYITFFVYFCILKMESPNYFRKAFALICTALIVLSASGQNYVTKSGTPIFPADKMTLSLPSPAPTKSSPSDNSPPCPLASLCPMESPAGIPCETPLPDNAPTGQHPRNSFPTLFLPL